MHCITNDWVTGQMRGIMKNTMPYSCCFMFIALAISASSTYAATTTKLALPSTPAKLVLPKVTNLTDSIFTISGGDGDHSYFVDPQSLPSQDVGVFYPVSGTSIVITNNSGSSQTLCIAATAPGPFVENSGPQFPNTTPAVYYKLGIDCAGIGGENVRITDPYDSTPTFIASYQSLLNSHTSYTCTFHLGFENSPASASNADNLGLITPGTYTTNPISITFYQGSNFNCPNTTPPPATPENTVTPTFSVTTPPVTTFSLAQSTLNFLNISQSNWQQPQSISSNFSLTSNDSAGVNVSLTPTDGSNNYRLTNGSNAVQLSASVRPCGVNSPTSALIPRANSHIDPQYLTQDCNINPGAITLTLPALSFSGTAGVNMIPPAGVYSNTFTLDVSNT